MNNKKLLVLAGFALTSSLGAFADLNDLRSSFAAVIPQAKAMLDRASQLKMIPVELGAPLSQADCLAFETKARVNYKIDPFNLVHKNGSTDRVGMCGGLAGFGKNFLRSQSGVSNFGQPFSTVVQLQQYDGDIGGMEIVNHFFDEKWRVVEIQSNIVRQNPLEKDFKHIGISSIDTQGNLYLMEDRDHYSISGTSGVGENIITHVVLADGSTPFGYVRNLFKAPDVTQNIEYFSVDRADQKDWQDFQIMLTHGSGYYEYDGDYYVTFVQPNYRSSLSIVSKGGKESCSYGSTKSNDDWQNFPDDQTEIQNCGNLK